MGWVCLVWLVWALWSHFSTAHELAQLVWDGGWYSAATQAWHWPLPTTRHQEMQLPSPLHPAALSSATTGNALPPRVKRGIGGPSSRTSGTAPSEIVQVLVVRSCASHCHRPAFPNRRCVSVSSGPSSPAHPPLG